MPVITAKAQIEVFKWHKKASLLSERLFSLKAGFSKGTWYYSLKEFIELFEKGGSHGFSSISVQNYLEILAKDERINVWHMALIYALIRLSFGADILRVVNSSRRQIIRLSHIKNFMTNYKYMKELQYLGYLLYKPSYHPDLGTEMQSMLPQG